MRLLLRIIHVTCRCTRPVCVCMHTQMHACTHVYMQPHTCLHVSMRASTSHTRMHTRVYVCFVCLCVYDASQFLQTSRLAAGWASHTPPLGVLWGSGLPGADLAPAKLLRQSCRTRSSEGSPGPAVLVLDRLEVDAQTRGQFAGAQTPLPPHQPPRRALFHVHLPGPGAHSSRDELPKVPPDSRSGKGQLQPTC